MGQVEAVVVHRKVDERDVDLVVEQRSGLIGPVDPFDLDIRVVVRGVERPHQRDDRIAGDEADCQGDSAGCGAPDPPPRRGGGCEQELGILEELTSGGSQLNVAARPGQQVDADVLL